MLIRNLLALFVLLVTAIPANADVITFEGGGFVDQQAVGIVPTASNSVTFSVSGGGTGFIAQTGGQVTAFVPGDNTVNPGISGSFYLTDEVNGPGARRDYFLAFASPISNLSLDLYDFRGDGGNSTVATLTLFDALNNAVGSESFTVPNVQPPNGNIENLSVIPSGLAVSASLTFNNGGDAGTGIDNIAFTTVVPEPASIALWITLLLAVSAACVMRRKTLASHVTEM